MRKRTIAALTLGTLTNITLGGILGLANGTAPSGPWWNIKQDILYICGTWNQVPLLFAILTAVNLTALLTVYTVTAPFTLWRNHHARRLHRDTPRNDLETETHLRRMDR